MTRRYAWSGSEALLGILWAVNLAMAQAEGAPAGKQQDQGVEQATPQDDGKAPAPERRPEGGKAFTRRQITQLKKLELGMKEKLRLSPEQKKTIEQLFRARLVLLEEGQDDRQARDADSKDVEEMRALREELKKARQAGDEKRAGEIRTQLREKLRGRLGAGNDATSEFLDKVAAELDENQRVEFRKLVRRLGIDTPRGPRDMELRRLWRAIKEPDVGLSDQQQRAIQTTLRNATASLADSDADAQKAEQIMAKARADVFKELSPEQQSKVEAALKADQERGEKRRRSGDRLEYPTPYPKDAGVNNADTQPAGEPDQPPDDAETDEE